MSIFEATMLLCFGIAWPFSIYRSVTSRSNNGKSLIFLLIVFAGYVAGLIHKIINDFDMVFYLYIVNGSMVLIDIALFIRNKRFSAMPRRP